MNPWTQDRLFLAPLCPTPRIWTLTSSDWIGSAALSLEHTKAIPLEIHLSVFLTEQKKSDFVDLLASYRIVRRAPLESSPEKMGLNGILPSVSTTHRTYRPLLLGNSNALEDYQLDGTKWKFLTRWPPCFRVTLRRTPSILTHQREFVSSEPPHYSL